MDHRERQPLIYAVCRAVLEAWLRIWCRYEAKGMENVPESGGVVLACNHASFIDPMVAGCALRRRFIRFMARDTLARFKPLGWWMRAVGAITLDRTRGDLAALKQAIAMLKSGSIVCLFPEGTRTRDGQLQPAKGGVGFLIAKAGVPVVPTYLKGTFDALPRGAIFVRPRKVSVRYGKPITPAEIADLAAGKDAYERIGELVMRRIAALKD